MPVFDANVVLRYLLNDHPEMSSMARDMVLAGGAVTPEVLAEVVYVLKGVYRVERTDIAKALATFVLETETSNKEAVLYALRLFGKTSLDFVDCLLAGYHHIMGLEIKTFDKKLQKVLDSDQL